MGLVEGYVGRLSRHGVFVSLCGRSDAWESVLGEVIRDVHHANPSYGGWIIGNEVRGGSQELGRVRGEHGEMHGVVLSSEVAGTAVRRRRYEFFCEEKGAMTMGRAKAKMGWHGGENGRHGSGGAGGDPSEG